MLTSCQKFIGKRWGHRELRKSTLFCALISPTVSNDFEDFHQRETARLALLHQQGEFLAATHQYEAAARQNLVNSSARNNEAHKYNVQMQARHLEQETDARFSRFSSEANQPHQNQGGNLVTEVSFEVWGRDEQVFGVRAELSLHAPHQEDVTQQQSQEYAGQHQHMAGLVQETQQHRAMFEGSRVAHSATGPEIERLRQRETELAREARQQKNARASFDALFIRNRTFLECSESRTSENQQIIHDLCREFLICRPHTNH